ncbi:MAG: hypothetical protein Q8L41_04615 [Anaerolineales bacterium]|nr:hypothetical protein [Anaerolineales bacterium]
MDDLLQQGITAHKAGKRDEARKIFINVVKQSPDSERAWGWMYDVSNNDNERIYCLKQMLRINPKYEKANQLLNQLLTPSFTSSPSPTPIAPSPIQVNSPRIVAKKSNSNFFIIAVAVSSLTFIVICLCLIGSQIMTQTTEPVTVQNTSEILAYLRKTQPITDSLSNANYEFANEMIQMRDNPDLYYDQTWRSQVSTTMGKLLALASELESIEPVPQQLKTVDSYYDQIASETRLLVSNYQLFLDGDESYIYKALENVNRMNSLLDLATEEINKFSNP